MDTASSAVDVLGLTKVFGRFTAVDGLSVSIGQGEIFGLLGPNGAGKSTLIRMLCGLLSSTSGTARVGGFDINLEPERVRESIGYMSQRFSLYRDLTVGENMMVFGGLYGLSATRLQARLDEVILSAGLEGMMDRLAGALSGAVQQRLALACSILHEPRILFLDEPTSGVDPLTRRTFWDMIRNLASGGVTVLVTTHFMDEAEFCGRIGFISSGRLVALGTPAELRQTGVREDLFEVSAADVERTREMLRHLPGVEAVTYFGSRLHVFCRPGEFTVASLQARIEGTGDVSVRRSEVTLEDAFVRLAGGGGRKAEGRGQKSEIGIRKPELEGRGGGSGG